MELRYQGDVRTVRCSSHVFKEWLIYIGSVACTGSGAMLASDSSL
jgi:hypothetical protein